MSEIPKPCLFCESSDVHVAKDCHDDPFYFVECTNCFATGPLSRTAYIAVNKWNAARNDWISVKERLPRSVRAVPVVFDNGHSTIAAYALRQWHLVTTEVLLGPKISRPIVSWYDVPEPPELSNDSPKT